MTGYEALMKFYPLTLGDLPDEQWKPVPDYEGYEVSNFGRVKSFHKGKQRILKPQVFSKGYLHVMLCKASKQKWISIHRLVAICFILNPLNKPQVNHIDGHPLNCHVSNLEWCTPAENQRHAVVSNLIPSGEDNYLAKLSNKQVEFIRENPDGLNVSALAKMFDVHVSVISDIQTGKAYKQVGGVVRKAQKRIVLSDDIREAIRAEYKPGIYGCGSHVLAKKYGVAPVTIRKIFQEI